MDSFADLDEVESIVYIAREISVFKVPPLKTNQGYRAAEWGNLSEPLWKGRMRVIEKSSDGVSLRLEDPNTGDLFAQAKYDPAKPCVDAVLDSSRYFVIRIEEQGRKAYIGIGFAERTDSFDFNVALQDYTKRWKAAKNPTAEPSSDPQKPLGPKVDYSLKEDQTFKISIPGRSGGSTSKPSSSLLGSSGGAGIPLLPPPPSAPRRN